MASWIVSSCFSRASSLVRVFTARSVVDSMSDSNFLTFWWSSFKSCNASMIPSFVGAPLVTPGTTVRITWSSRGRSLQAYPCAYAATPFACLSWATGREQLRRRRLKMPLRRATIDGPAISRRRRGRGFSYVGPNGPVTDAEALERIRALVIPPAWTDVRISPDPLGHIQAVGMDAAGRRQYLYHADWRVRRDEEKFERMVEFANALPALRERVSADLSLRGLPRARALACAVRLLDHAYIREEAGGDFSAKDFRTWHATVLAAVHLALGHAESTSLTSRRRIVSGTVREVAGFLGNTPAVARASYIDPRVIARFEDGVTIGATLERLRTDDPTDPEFRATTEEAVLELPEAEPGNRAGGRGPF